MPSKQQSTSPNARKRANALPSSTSLVARPPFEHVKQFLKQGLADGQWPPGALMPSEAELVAQFSVSRMTVGRAIRELQQEGLVVRTQGVGTFAAELHRVSSSLTIRDIHEEIVARGHEHRASVHTQRAERSSAAVAKQLGLTTGEIVFHSLLVHYENDVPLQCEDRFVNPVCAPDYLSIDFTAVTPTHYLLEVAPLLEAQFSVEAGMPSTREAKLLAMRVDEPCLIVSRRTINRDTPITCARLVHPASRYQIESSFKPY